MPEDLKGAVVLRAQLILSCFITVAATYQLVLGNHLLHVDDEAMVVLQLSSFDTSLQPGKCVLSKCL